MPLDVFLRDAFDPFWVQGDSFDGLPISGVTAPSGRSVLLGLFIHLMAMSQDGFVLTRMALLRCHKLNAAVAVLMLGGFRVCGSCARPLRWFCPWARSTRHPCKARFAGDITALHWQAWARCVMAAYPHIRKSRFIGHTQDFLALFCVSACTGVGRWQCLR